LKLEESSLNPAGVAENADAIVMAKSLVGALVSRHAVIATAAIARPTIRIVVTVQSCIEVRKQDTRKKINPDAAF